jgi:hypothetical protein
MRNYLIKHKKQMTFWSNEWGWTDVQSADFFSEEEKQNIHYLPIAGIWITTWEAKSIQFSRFISECEACGVFSNEDHMQEVADGMDLELEDLFGIISQAQIEFAELCKKL